MTRAAAALRDYEAASVLLCPLADAHDERLAGGKASNLARLIALRAPVPQGEVLTRHALDIFLARSHAASALGEAIRRLDTALTTDALRDASDRVRALILDASLPFELEAALTTLAQRWLQHGALAVRSSAVGEDGSDASFAGQFDSVLGVTSLDGLRDAIRACYASYWSVRAISYRRARHIAPAGMALVIQHLVDPAAAGVLFTRNPDPHPRSRETLAIEYCAGLADRLVSGAADPGRIVVSRTTHIIVSEHAAEDASDIAVSATVARAVPELVRLAMHVEGRLGTPQDIEWAVDADGAVWLVQTRPITTRHLPPAASATPVSGRRTADVLWTNANVNENFPGPLSPLLYSIASAGYYHYFRNLGLAFGVSRRRLEAMDRPLRSVIGVHAARMYYNLTNIHAVLRMAPFGERLAAAFNTFVGAHEAPAPPPAAVRWGDRRGCIRQSLELARIVAWTTWQYLFLGARIRAFERTADDFGARTRSETLREDSLPALGALLARFVDIRCHRWKNASLADAAAMVTYSTLERLLAGGGFGASTHTRLLRALPGVPSSVPPRRLWALSRLIRAQPDLRTVFDTAEPARILATVGGDDRFETFRVAFGEFFDTWGFRSSGELMLTTPGLDEQPEALVALLKQYVQDSGESPESVMARQSDERRRETAHILRTLARRSPFRAAAVWLLVHWTQRSIVYRERARFKQALLYTRCRRVALHIGDRLVAKGWLQFRDDVFFLTCAEIDELTAGRAMLPLGSASLVRLRRRQHAQVSQVPPPDVFRLPEGDTFVGDLSDAATETTRDEQEVAVVGTVFSGTTACGGRVTARAAVLRGVEEASRLTRGDVLVTRQTDPGWAPVFCLISGLVIERGGMLSHGAIIAREFGLPCVVGVKRATTRIPHGATVTVDGDRGVCALEADA